MNAGKRVVELPGSLLDGVKDVIRRLKKSRGKTTHPKIKEAREVLEIARDMATQEVLESEQHVVLLAGLNHASRFLCEARKKSRASELEEIQQYVLDLHAHFSAIHRQ